MFHSDWLEGLRQCPKKGWAGEVLTLMRENKISLAWGALHLALRGVE